MNKDKLRVKAINNSKKYSFSCKSSTISSFESGYALGLKDGIGNSPKKEVKELVFDVYRFDPILRNVFIGDQYLFSLTKIHSIVFSILISNTNTLSSYSEMCEAVWGEMTFYNKRCLNVHILALNKKIKDLKNISIINQHGDGYIFINQNN